MKRENLDRGWEFRLGAGSPYEGLVPGADGQAVDLPHDYMIASEVDRNAPAGTASGFYNAGVAHYTKQIRIPAEWKDERVLLYFEGAMLNATVEVNSCRVCLQHYGYAPFCADITPYLYFGEENALCVTVNPSMQPNSRWYSGAGLFRSVWLLHGSKLSVVEDSLFLYTDRIEYRADGSAQTAYLKVQAEAANDTDRNLLVDVTFALSEESSGREVISRRTRVQVNPHARETAKYTLTLDEPALWSAEHPSLYRLSVRAEAVGEFRTHVVPLAEGEAFSDEASVLTGIRTITADVRHGLQINGKTVKLKGGCLHHDNGLLGAVSLYDAEVRKLRKLRESGYNAVRTTHNPPSPAFIEACDRLGMYVFDEAFDAWHMGKQPGDYNQYFDTDWEKDLTAFVRRDRSHPCVILWSTGNEITERGGLGNGYRIAAQLAGKVKSLDPSRPVSNAICSFWNGLDRKTMLEVFQKAQEAGTAAGQNADLSGGTLWEDYTEPFTNGLDIVGYNYMESRYAGDHERYPERVMLGSENFPKEIGIHWPMIEKTPYVIGDFTWTAFDYLGEAGIGKAVSVEPDDPILQPGSNALSSQASVYPWRTANDADFDITGMLLPQGAYRRVVWGDRGTYVFSADPQNTGKVEVISPWGFPDVRASWNWPGQEGKAVRVTVFSRAEAVELFVNGRSVGVKKQGESLNAGLPCSFVFDTVYEPGKIEAVSRNVGSAEAAFGGCEISHGSLETVGAPERLVLRPERTEAQADGHHLFYVDVEIQDAEGRLVPDAAISLTAAVEGVGRLLGFGSGNPVTEDNYTKGACTTFRGRALAVVRAGYETGETTLRVESETLGAAECVLMAD